MLSTGFTSRRNPPCLLFSRYLQRPWFICVHGAGWRSGTIKLVGPIMTSEGVYYD